MPIILSWNKPTAKKPSHNRKGNQGKVLKSHYSNSNTSRKQMPHQHTNISQLMSYALNMQITWGSLTQEANNPLFSTEPLQNLGEKNCK